MLAAVFAMSFASFARVGIGVSTWIMLGRHREETGRAAKLLMPSIYGDTAECRGFQCFRPYRINERPGFTL